MNPAMVIVVDSDRLTIINLLMCACWPSVHLYCESTHLHNSPYILVCMTRKPTDCIVHTNSDLARTSQPQMESHVCGILLETWVNKVCACVWCSQSICMFLDGSTTGRGCWAQQRSRRSPGRVQITPSSIPTLCCSSHACAAQLSAAKSSCCCCMPLSLAQLRALPSRYSLLHDSLPQDCYSTLACHRTVTVH